MFQYTAGLTVNHLGGFQRPRPIHKRPKRLAGVESAYQFNGVEMRRLPKDVLVGISEFDAFDDLGFCHALIQSFADRDPKRPSTWLPFVANHTDQTHRAIQQLEGTSGRNAFRRSVSFHA